MKSLMDKVNEIIGLSFKILYESNPNRKGWDNHPVNVNDDIKGVKLNDTVSTDAYYLYECYSDLLGEEMVDKLWHINEGFSLWVEKFENGLCSINDAINVYTIENLEKLIAEYEPIVNKAWDIRCNWIESVK